MSGMLPVRRAQALQPDGTIWYLLQVLKGQPSQDDQMTPMQGSSSTLPYALHMCSLCLQLRTLAGPPTPAQPCTPTRGVCTGLHGVRHSAHLTLALSTPTPQADTYLSNTTGPEAAHHGVKGRLYTLLSDALKHSQVFIFTLTARWLTAKFHDHMSRFCLCFQKSNPLSSVCSLTSLSLIMLAIMHFLEIADT